MAAWNGDNPKLVETELTWKPTDWISRLFNLIVHRKLYRFSTPWYSENWFDMNEHYIQISVMQERGLNFLVAEAADRSLERRFIKFFACDTVDLTALSLMK